MNTFDLVSAQSINDAVNAQARSNTAQQGASIRFIAGGTNLVDYMKINVEKPVQIIDINALALDAIKATPEGGL
ncbi:MAG: FAD binding domain-containing protein, partial [Povalibacter sp.]